MFPAYRMCAPHTGKMTNHFPSLCSTFDQHTLHPNSLILALQFEQCCRFRFQLLSPLFSFLPFLISQSLSFCLLPADWHVCTGDRWAEEGDGPDISDNGQGTLRPANVKSFSFYLVLKLNFNHVFFVILWDFTLCNIKYLNRVVFH